MKIAGEKISGINTQPIVFERGQNKIVLIAEAIIDWSEFDNFCPEPTPPKRRLPGTTGLSEDRNDPSYKEAMEKYGKCRFYWIIYKSLSATPDLEWETIQPQQSETWLNLEQELKDSGFTQIEINRIVEVCLAVNSLSEKALERAKQDFLAQKGQQGK